MPISRRNTISVPASPWGLDHILKPNAGQALTHLGFSALAAALPPLATTRAWKQALNAEHVLDVRDYGAVDDGVTPSAAAIQDCIDDSSAGDTILFPGHGVYLIDTPLVPASRRYLGSGIRGATLKADAANGDSIFKFVSAQRHEYIGLQFRSDNPAAYAFKGSDLTQYTDTCLWHDCSFYDEFHTDLYGVLANCRLVRCWFGYLGAGALANKRHVYSGAGTGIKASFGNHFDQCWFWKSAGEAASVHFVEGNTLKFDNCIWQKCATPAVKTEGIANVVFDNCNWEDVEPSLIDADNALIRMDADPTTSYVGRLTVRNSWIQNNGHSHAAPWAAMAKLSTSGGDARASFENVNGNGGNMYWTVTGGVYDVPNNTVVLNSNVSALASTFSQDYSIGRPVYARNEVPFRAIESAIAPGGVSNGLYLDDGTNTRDGAPGWRRWTGTEWEDLAWAIDQYRAGGQHVVGALKLGVAPSAPTGWWKCDDNAATTAVVDSGGSGFDLAAQANTDTLDTPGIVGAGTALTFDGSTDYLSRAASTFTDSQGTIAAWVKLSAYPGSAATVFGSGDEASATKRLWLSITSTGLLRFRRHNGTNEYIVTGDTVIPLDVWTHVAVVSDGSAWTLYVNGKVQALTVSGGNNGDWFADVTGRDNITVGVSKINALAYYLTGAIDDVRVYAVALTAAQVKYIWCSKAETFVGSMEWNGLAVTLGANDSAGAGYRLLRVPNA